ncbi:MAG: metallophosphoesterase [Planctomycetes bacterium]|nr:metallophosphoesterase [Planctomycetota bacterium]
MSSCTRSACRPGLPWLAGRIAATALLVALCAAGARAQDGAARAPARLLGPPLLVRPTTDGITIHVVFAGEGGEGIGLEVWPDGEEGPLDTDEPRAPPPPELLAPDALLWRVTGLRPATRYRYRIRTGDRAAAAGSFVTRRPPGEAFTFALLSDAHIFVRDFTEAELAAHPLPAAVVRRYRTEENAKWTLRMWRAYGHAILPRVAGLVRKDRPDFLVNLGDVIDLHGFGFNVPVPDESWMRKGLLDYRRLLGPLAAHVAHFTVLGNWDGESGHFSEAEQQRARGPRHIYLPNPRPEDAPEGGGVHQDYYAFTWGDALFVVLNVVSYTPTAHLLDRTADPGRPDDYTLGEEQMAWFARTLAEARSRWRFVCIHHAVGGNAGDVRNSAYGRGGGRAAQVGEQARVHALLRKHGVHVFFYGHDHVFTDRVVDGIHYTLPGSAGAPWKFTRAETGYETSWPDSGYARVHVAPDRVEVVFVDVEGRQLHRYALGVD